jgi:hypothetical protein
MVSFKDIQRRVAESAEDTERKIRSILPVSKGGDVKGRTIQEQIEDNLSGLMPETTRVITNQQPIPTSKITRRKDGATSTRSRSGSGGSRGSRGKEVATMVTEVEALAEVINNPNITIDERLKNLINSPTVGMDPITGQIGPIEDGFGDSRNRASIDAMQLSRQFERQNVLPAKKKRKVSKYQKEFGRQLKLLKKKHPRTAVTRLMKRAHAATRKALKKK